MQYLLASPCILSLSVNSTSTYLNNSLPLFITQLTNYGERLFVELIYTNRLEMNGPVCCEVCVAGRLSLSASHSMTDQTDSGSTNKTTVHLKRRRKFIWACYLKVLSNQNKVTGQVLNSQVSTYTQDTQILTDYFFRQLHL